MCRFAIFVIVQVLAKVKSLGYDGIEAPVAVAMEYGTTAFKAALKEAGLQYIAMVFSSGGAPT
jgi:sugar phosphate isomerase/epimerase